MARHRPFLEVLGYSLNEDYRFPTLEALVFLFAFGAFVFADLCGTGAQFVTSQDDVAFGLVNSMTGLPLFILAILMLKNMAFGLGNDLEKGTIQTFLAYPLKRRSFLAAKTLSSTGAAILLFMGIQLFAIFILVPDIMFQNLGTVLLAYAAVLANPFFIVVLSLAFVLVLKKGSIALVLGVILYFALGILSPVVTGICQATGSSLPLKALALVNPALGFQLHFVGGFGGQCWSPSLQEAFVFLAICYAMIISILVGGFLYFERRLET